MPWVLIPFRRPSLARVFMKVSARVNAWRKGPQPHRDRRETLLLESAIYRCRIGQTVEKVCCWHQDLSVSTFVRFRSFSNS